jgi:putative phosphoesterase
MRVGVVSDTHGSYFLLQKALEAMGGIDLLIHAGDGADEMKRLLSEHPVRCEQVAGNCDAAPYLPTQTRFDLAGYRVFLTHGHLFGVKSGLLRIAAKGLEEEAKVVVFGHTHEPTREEYRGVLLFNPGSLSSKAYGSPSYGLLELDKDGIKAEIRYL